MKMHRGGLSLLAVRQLLAIGESEPIAIQNYLADHIEALVNEGVMVTPNIITDTIALLKRDFPLPGMPQGGYIIRKHRPGSKCVRCPGPTAPTFDVVTPDGGIWYSCADHLVGVAVHYLKFSQ